MESDIPYLCFKALLREQVIVDILLYAAIDMGGKAYLLAHKAGAVIGVNGYFRIRVVVLYMGDSEDMVIVAVGEKNILEILHFVVQDSFELIRVIAGVDNCRLAAVLVYNDITVSLNGSHGQGVYLHHLSFLQMSVSSTMVTGPSLAISTAISAPNMPFSTFPTPFAESSEQNSS